MDNHSEIILSVEVTPWTVVLVLICLGLAMLIDWLKR